MSTGEAAPTILQNVIMGGAADFDGQNVCCARSWGGLAAAYQVGTWSANGILDYIGEEARESDADDEAEDCDVSFVEAGPQEDCVENEEQEWDQTSVDDVLKGSHTLVEGIWV